MKSTILALSVVMLIVAGTASAAVTTLVYPETKNMVTGQNGWNGSTYGKYLYNVNNSTGANGYGYRLNESHQTDMSVWDYDRAALVQEMENDVMDLHPGLTGFTFTSAAQLGAAQGNMVATMWIQPANDWQNRNTDTPFSYGFVPSLRLSKTGVNWVDTEATMVQINSTGAAWDDSLGNAQLGFMGTMQHPTLATYRGDTNSWVMNATAELWGLPHNWLDTYGYGKFRPWNLDASVAWEALHNPYAAGFTLQEDASIETGEAQLGCVGTIFSHRSGLTATRPYLTVVFDPALVDVGTPPPTHSWLEADFNHSQWVTYKDYIILEGSFGKTNQTQQTGDADGNGTVNYKDYIILEAQFGKSDGQNAPLPAVPEPLTLGLLAAGGFAILRRKA